ncbi:MAG TPA: alpha/beta hydrolase [Symbiobacteriaceae bacterium]|nr:alpha/beta hydrolase [Symbiobacteriaceae bacterium]
MDREKFRLWCRENASRPGIDWCGQFLDVEGELLHYVEAGSGEPLVLLHGFMEWSFTWRSVMRPLAGHSRVLALDLRGFGLSGRDRRLGHSLTDQVEVVRRFLDSLGVQQAVFCGHSMGGEIALRFALQYPERVRGLVLVAASGYLRPRQRPLRRWLLRLPGISQAVVRAVVLNRRFADRALREVHADPDRVTAADVDAYLLPARAPGTAGTLVRILRDADFGHWSDRLAEVAHPSLLIWGDSDPVVSLEQGRRLAAALPKSRLEVFSRCGHLPHVEEPVQFVGEVVEFLRGL